MSDDGDGDDGPIHVGASWTGESWLAVAFDRSGFETADVFPGVGDLWARFEERAERVLVDVPVGLVEEGDPERQCDALARAVLGARADAVVTPPVREATRKRRYPAAKRVNRRKADHPLSEAAFEASDAIAAVDELLQNVPEARDAVVETHPEVCFRAFAGEPLEHDPALAGGYAERLRTLAGYDRDAPPAVQAVAESAAGHEVTVADVLDATVMAYTARPGPGELRSLPADPPTDAHGLPMRIIYRSESPLVEA